MSKTVKIVDIHRMTPRRFGALAGSISLVNRSFSEPRLEGYKSDCLCRECCRRRARVPDEQLPTVGEVFTEMQRRLAKLR